LRFFLSDPEGVPVEGRFAGVPVVAESELPVVSVVTKRQWMVLVSGMYEKTFSGGRETTVKGCTWRCGDQ
jgi:hypothetical protein